MPRKPRAKIKAKGSLEPFPMGTPKFRSPYEARFKDPEDAKRVLIAVANFLRVDVPGNRDYDACFALGFAIESTEVRPSTKIQRMKMETRFATGSVILHVPRGKDESEEAFQARERRILAEFSTTVYEAQMRSAWEFYWALDDHGKRSLMEKYGHAQR
jgi:hypothetical protein